MFRAEMIMNIIANLPKSLKRFTNRLDDEQYELASKFATSLTTVSNRKLSLYEKNIVTGIGTDVGKQFFSCVNTSP